MAPVGVGGGIGMTPISTTAWFMGFVNNICPECERGSLDQVTKCQLIGLLFYIHSFCAAAPELQQEEMKRIT